MKKLTRKQVLAGASALAAVLIGLAVWLFWPDSQLAKVKAMEQELARTAGDKVDPAERRRRWEEFNREQRKLSPAQRRQLGEEFRKQRQAEVDRYFKMSKAEKTRWLDQQIDRMERMRRSRPPNGGPGAPPGAGGPPGPGRGNLSPEQRENRRKQRLDSTTPEERAQRDQLRKDLAARRAQRGLPASPFGFGGR
jgi:hypothetical protein